MKIPSSAIFQRIFLTACLAVCTIAGSPAMTQADSCDVSVPAACESDSVVKPKGIINKLLAYFQDTNKPKESKAFDFSVIGGPHYSSDAGFGIGLIAAGLYRTDPTDTLCPPSSVSIFADATTKKHFNIGIEGYHLFRGDRSRLNYIALFQSLSTDFWGIGYDEGICDANESKYDYLRVKIDARYLIRFGRHLYVGPKFNVDYVHGRNFEKPELWHGEGATSTAYGPGLCLSYDTRDNITNAYSGVYLALDQSFYPAFIGNEHAYSRTDFTACTYHQVWKGGVLAWCGKFSLGYGDITWSQLSQLGGNTMRGYFQGRYRDKSSWTICVELRQHIWHRNGAVVWVGAGEVFPKISQMRLRHILPNAGIGYRWEFKHRMNIRIDVGFGRDGAGFMFNINEAF